MALNHNSFYFVYITVQNYEPLVSLFLYFTVTFPWNLVEAPQTVSLPFHYISHNPPA